MKLLITGGAGFIGSHLADRRLARGDRVVVLDDFNDFYDPAVKRAQRRCPRGKRAPTGWSRATSATAPCVLRLFAEERFDAVLHLAARAGVRPSLTQPVLYEEVNCIGTLRLLEAAVAHGKPRFLFASSSSVYGINSKLPFSEEDPDRPARSPPTRRPSGPASCTSSPPPPPRPARRVPALLHRLRPAAAAGDGDRPVHPLPRGRASRSPSTATAARGATTPTSTTSSTASRPRSTRASSASRSSTSAARIPSRSPSSSRRSRRATGRTATPRPAAGPAGRRAGHVRVGREGASGSSASGRACRSRRGCAGRVEWYRSRRVGASHDPLGRIGENERELSMNICMVGTGYVGLVTGACLADFGMNVICVDKDEAKIAALQRGRHPDLRAGPRRARRARTSASRAPALHDRPEGRHRERARDLHRRRHAAEARRLARPDVRPPGRRGDRRAHERLQGRRHEVDRADRAPAR